MLYKTHEIHHKMSTSCSYVENVHRLDDAVSLSDKLFRLICLFIKFRVILTVAIILQSSIISSQ